MSKFTYTVRKDGRLMKRVSVNGKIRTIYSNDPKDLKKQYIELKYLDSKNVNIEDNITFKTFAEDWIKYNGTIMIITLKNNGTNGHPNYCYYIEDITYTKNQKEVLISSHSYFTITGIKRGKENELDYINLICEGFLFSD